MVAFAEAAGFCSRSQRPRTRGVRGGRSGGSCGALGISAAASWGWEGLEGGREGSLSEGPGEGQQWGAVGGGLEGWQDDGAVLTCHPTGLENMRPVRRLRVRT